MQIRSPFRLRGAARRDRDESLDITGLREAPQLPHDDSNQVPCEPNPFAKA